MDNFFALLLVVSCVGIWYFIKKQPNKEYRNFAIGAAIVSLMLFGFFSPDDKKETTKTEEVSTKSTSSKEKTSESTKKAITIEIADSFETDSSGNVTITGKTEPNARVQIGFGVLNEPVTVDTDGNFSLSYSLPTAKDKKINILASLDGNTGSKDITIRPSAEFLASNENGTSSNNDSDVPTEYKSALRSAETYSKVMHMSKAGIYDQLTSEYGDKFPPEAAQYAIDNIKADWNANALASAKNYQTNMAMSTEAIRDQLTSEYGEQFTPEEAEYAIQNLGN